MQINEIGSNAPVQNMSETAAKGKKAEQKETEESFHKSLRENMCPDKYESAYVLKNEEQTQCREVVHSHRKQQLAKSAADAISIRVSASENIPEGQEVSVRGIPYEECDRVEIHILEGYTLKAKLEMSETGETETGKIYVEMKTDDGETKAYLFNSTGLRNDSTNVMEQFAYAVAKTEHTLNSNS